MMDNMASQLNSMQLGIYYDQLLTPDSSRYNIGIVTKIIGALDNSWLEKSFRSVLCSSEHLVIDTLLAQPGSLFSGGSIHLCDLTQLSKEEAAAKAETEMDSLMNTVVPLDRVFNKQVSILYNVSSDESWWFLMVHHLVSDGVGLINLAKRTGDVYQKRYCNDAFTCSTSMRLGKNYEKAKTYWRNELEGLAEAWGQWNSLQPKRKSNTSDSASICRLALPKQLEQVIEDRGVSIVHAVRAAFSIVFWRTYNIRNDLFWMGNTFHGREKSQIDFPLGMHSRILPLALQFSCDAAISEVLQQLNRKSVGAYRNQHYSTRQMALDHGVVDSTCENLTPAYFNYIDLSSELHFGEAKGAIDVVENACESGPIQLRLYKKNSGYELVLYCKTSRFSFNQSQQILHSVLLHIEDIAQSDHAKKIADLNVLSHDEKTQLSALWDSAVEPFPHDKCVHQLFETQVELTPDAIALEWMDKQYTYTQLNRHANQLALELIQKDVRPGKLVAICMQRSADMIIAMLAVLKTGCAYLPLDVRYPTQRLQDIVEDADPEVLLVHDATKAMHIAGVSHVCLEENASFDGVTNLNLNCDAEQLAYVIYTSGSTGKPKGVAIPHRAINRLVFDKHYVDVIQSDCVAQASNSAFDAATFEIWTALIHGAKLVVVPESIAASPREYSDFITRNGINTLFLTTSLFNQFAWQCVEGLGKCKHIVFGGEKADVQAVNRVREHARPGRLVNGYGPTETTTFATWFDASNLTGEEKSVPIGKPIANTNLYVLDERLNPVPVGAVGELYIAGAGLAQGYYKQPGLTAEKFLPNPFSRITGDRMYKTNDLVRYGESGMLEYLSRIDTQVKIRGFRIELSEIEIQLATLSCVQGALVTVAESEQGNKRLIAYLTTEDSESFNLRDVKAHVKAKLPEYMVPSVYVVLQAFPLTENGKLDYNSLPKPDWQQVTEDDTALSTPTEIMLAEVWCDLLELEHIGANADFFALGGHSLLATQCISRMRELTGIDLLLADFFEMRRLSVLAEHYQLLLSVSNNSVSTEHDDLEEMEF